jgi:hypothetical protein
MSASPAWLFLSLVLLVALPSYAHDHLSDERLGTSLNLPLPSSASSAPLLASATNAPSPDEMLVFVGGDFYGRTLRDSAPLVSVCSLGGDTLSSWSPLAGGVKTTGFLLDQAQASSANPDEVGV